ncbi:MAG TPA: DUF3426 domain-containing protein [Geminicoccaceae bacterium]|nr:DUF3426 domain-containing protein [Geminicoccus sp.]HMU48840.1 DUF3426 domain-containing protein [Geminicoccaceae bacterium]
MILICPECATRYRLADNAIGPDGRSVRCKACGHRWHATLASVAAAELAAASPPARPPVAAPPPQAVPEPPEPAPLPPPLAAGSRSRRDRALGAVAWLCLALLVLVLTAAYVGRNQVVEAFPSMATVYQKVGLRVELRSGLELRNLNSVRTEENGRQVLVVTGEIHNTVDQERSLPRVRVALLDDSRGEIEFGLFDAVDRTLAGGSTTRFEARLVDPPESAKTYSVSLADRL